MPKVSDRRRSRRRRDGQSRRRDDEVHHAAARLVASGLKVEQLRRVRDARDSLTRALRLPYTPSEWRDADCVAVIRHLRGDWKHIQAHFQGDPEAMKVIVDYRKRYIDGLINELAADKVKYPGLIARASGSTDLTSDYDVTLATADITADPDFTALDDAARLAAARGARDADARAAAELGRRIKETFGKQSATVFDTNFYLCDFLGSFTNNIVTGRPNAVAVARTSPASAAYQDVLALMKVRRYMRADEWRRYTRVAFPGTAHDRFDTADEIYRANVGALVKAVVATLALGDDEPVLAGLATDDDRLHALDSYRPDRVRAISDELCRAAEESLRRLQAELVERPAPERPEDERSEDEIRADIERATGQAAFFASEAYHTEGALLQIVVQRADLRPAALPRLAQRAVRRLHQGRPALHRRARPRRRPPRGARRAGAAPRARRRRHVLPRRQVHVAPAAGDRPPRGRRRSHPPAAPPAGPEARRRGGPARRHRGAARAAAAQPRPALARGPRGRGPARGAPAVPRRAQPGGPQGAGDALGREGQRRRARRRVGAP
jgi:hypothetical protein